MIKDDATLITPAKTNIALLNAALYTVFRVNMGGSSVAYSNDALWRTWENDGSFLETKGSSVEVRNMRVVHYRSGLSTRDFAPIEVYNTCRRLCCQKNNNITWKFTVDVTFQYLVRFHFCDIVSSSRNKRSFNLYINSWLASRQLKLTSLDNGFWAAPLYTDFVTEMLTGDEFSVSIGAALIHEDTYDAMLNGIEIMKISNVESSLAMAPSLSSSQQESYNHHIGTLVLAIAGVACLVVLATLTIISYRRRSKSPDEGHLETTIPYTTSFEASKTAILFPLASIKVLTNNFEESRVIGTGGFGKVYKAIFRVGKIVAVKRNTDQSEEGPKEFQTEIEMLSQFRHRNLVSLIGYCDEYKEIILVIDYMENGTLKDHLYGVAP